MPLLLRILTCDPLLPCCPLLPGHAAAAPRQPQMAVSLALALLPAVCLAAPPSKPWCAASRAGNYTNPIKGIQCRGLQPDSGARTAAKCAAACCDSPTCSTWLFGTNTHGAAGCWTSAGACSGARVAGWDGASKTKPIAPPPPPPPPPPAPPPPPPNGLRQLLYSTPLCSGTGTPDMTLRLGECMGVDPFPHNNTAGDVGTRIVGDINGSRFTVSKFASPTCGGAPSSSSAVSIGACVNVSAGRRVESVKWVKAWSPPARILD